MRNGPLPVWIGALAVMLAVWGISTSSDRKAHETRKTVTNLSAASGRLAPKSGDTAANLSGDPTLGIFLSSPVDAVWLERTRGTAEIVWDEDRLYFDRSGLALYSDRSRFQSGRATKSGRITSEQFARIETALAKVRWTSQMRYEPIWDHSPSQTLAVHRGSQVWVIENPLYGPAPLGNAVDVILAVSRETSWRPAEIGQDLFPIQFHSIRFEPLPARTDTPGPSRLKTSRKPAPPCGN